MSRLVVGGWGMRVVQVIGVVEDEALGRFSVSVSLSEGVAVAHARAGENDRRKRAGERIRTLFCSM